MHGKDAANAYGGNYAGITVLCDDTGSVDYEELLVCESSSDYRQIVMPQIRNAAEHGKIVRDFIEGQIYYKQNDLILWNVSPARKTEVINLYPDYDAEIRIEGGELLVYIEKNMIYSQEYNSLMDNCISAVYDVLVNRMVEEEHEQ